MRKWFSRAGFVVVVCTPLMFVAGPGYAATEVGKSHTTAVLMSTDNRLNVLAGTGSAHDIRIDLVEDDFIVTDTGNSLMTAAPCVHLTTPERVSCPLPISGITVEAGELNDVIQLSDSVTVPSRLVGGAGTDLIVGGAGNDFIDGGAGNDGLVGTAGNDSLVGGAGDDGLLGSAGNDDLLGDIGNDYLIGELGNDILAGGSGDDFIDGGAGDDGLLGDVGNDRLLGGTGNDALFGRDGVAANDSLDGASGADYCVADPGDTVINCP